MELKPLARDAVGAALDKAMRYRLLNEPAAAESICLDVLGVEPENQTALVMLLLSRTDQLTSAAMVEAARGILPQLRDEYERTFYAGLICERRANALLQQGGPGSSFTAYAWFQEAMTWYDKAEVLRPPGNDDPALRWNTCARILMRNRHLQPASEERTELPLE